MIASSEGTVGPNVYVQQADDQFFILSTYIKVMSIQTHPFKQNMNNNQPHIHLI